MSMKNILANGIVATLFISAAAHADIRLASPFTDHMVLQCGMKVPVWGTTEPGERVSVEFAGQQVSTTADVNGKWRVLLKPMDPSIKPQELVVSGKTSMAKCEDVLIGEVWLASGQSNMDFSMSKKVKSFAGVTNEEAEIAAANYPLIRMFVGEAQKCYAPIDRVNGQWKVCTPENAPAFSAVGYFFARDLQREIKIPWASSWNRSVRAPRRRGLTVKRWLPIRN
jgi:sialate O-acetylesterase